MKKSIIILSLFVGCQSLFSATFNIANGDVAGLISAITVANTNGQADIINLAANGTYVLNAVNYSSSSESEGQRGFPNILNNVSGLDLTINGNGATIQRSTSGPDFGFFSCTGHTVFNNIIFRNARVNARGAAIFVQFKGNVEVNNCSFYDNTSLLTSGEGGGGGIYTKSLSTLIVTNSYFENNSAVNQGGAVSNLLSNMTLIGNTFKNNRTTNLTGGAAGGAVYSDGARGDNGFLILRNNIFENNSSNGTGQGGAAFLFAYRNIAVEVTGCTFKTNSALQGGALWHKGGGVSQQQIDEFDLDDPEYPFTAGPENTTLTLNTCVFDGNTAVGPAGSGTGIGGGLWLSDCIINEIHSLTFKNNTAWLGGGAAFLTNRFFTVRNSTFNNNTADLAGGIAATISAPLDIINCTFNSNSVKLYGGAISVPHNSHAVNITNCTFANNQASGADNSQSAAIHSGNVSTTNNTVTIKNNIFSNNTVSNIYGNTWRDCNVNLNNGGNNIFFPLTTGAHCLSPQDSNFINPLLSPLANNGGPTQTMALQAGSPAINAGSGCPPADQRGVARVGTCDVGAYEYTGTLSIENLVKNNNVLQVYPNPSTGNFFIKAPKEYQTKGGSIQIFSLDGKLILTKDLNKSDVTSVSLTTKGVYILTVTIGGEIFSHKIVVH